MKKTETGTGTQTVAQTTLSPLTEKEIETTLQRLNNERLVCLARLFAAAFFVCVAVFSLWLSSKAGKGILTLSFLGIFLLFLAAAAVFYAFYKKAWAVYESDYTQNAERAAFASEFPNHSHGNVIDKSDIENSLLFKDPGGGAISEGYASTYEGFHFKTASLKLGENVDGLFFCFEFPLAFKQKAQVWQKGAAFTKEPGEIDTDSPFIKYQTGFQRFDFYFFALAADKTRGETVLTEPMAYSFLKTKEETKARIFASFGGNKLYLLFNNVRKSYSPPLIFKISLKKLKAETLDKIYSANSLAFDFILEKRIWKKHEDS